MRFVFMFAVLKTVFAARGNPCLTPNSELGTCLPVHSCTVILNAISTRNISALVFARKSQCGYDYQPLVCCGTLANFVGVISMDKVKPNSEKEPEGGAGVLKNGDPCTTPNKESAKCIPVRSCDVIVKALTTKRPSAIDFAQKSQCGYDNGALVCCGNSGFLTTTTISKPLNTTALPDNTICGLERETQRVKGGEVTGVDEFPWMAALEYTLVSNGDTAGIKCGGSLINTKYIMTAAHCLADEDLKIFRAWLGDWQLSTDPDCQKLTAITECADPVQKIRIAKQIPHPDFKISDGRNDIALLRLEREINYTDYIRPICLPTGNLGAPPVNINMVVAGWGITETGKESDLKLKVEVPLVSNEECNKRLHIPLTTNQFCAGGVAGKDSCRGDSGGPLMRAHQETIYSQQQWYLEGVVSYGLGCGRQGYPAIYTRVSKYMTWIVRVVS